MPFSKGKASGFKLKRTRARGPHIPDKPGSRGGGSRNRMWYNFKGPLLTASFCQLAPHAKNHEQWPLPKVLLCGDQELKPRTCRGHHRSQPQQLCLIWSDFGVFGLMECCYCHCCCCCLEPGPYYGTQPGLELITPLPPVSKYWNYRCISTTFGLLFKWIVIQQKWVA